MTWRRAREADYEIVTELWHRAKYGFELPDFDRFISSWVALEDGRIVAWAGACPVPEITAIMDPDWGTPWERRRLFATLHRPIARDVMGKGYQRVVCNLDPKYPSFGRHLLKMGWNWSWQSMWVKVERFIANNY